MPDNGFDCTNRAKVSSAQYNVQYVDCSSDNEEALLGLATVDAGETKIYMVRVKVGDAPLFVDSSNNDVFYTGLMSFDVVSISPELLVLKREPNTADIS